MRGYLASSIGVACSAALVLPLSLTSGAVAAPPQVPDLPGSTQSLPLARIAASDRSARSLSQTAEQGLTERDVGPFSMVGVVWDDVNAELHGTVQVRTRATGSQTWSGWQDVETHNHEHGADPGSAEGDSGKVRGSTAPLWVGESDGVEVRVRAEAEHQAPLPAGLRLELVNPGEELADGRSGANRADVAPSMSPTVLPALSRSETEAQPEDQPEVQPEAQAEVQPEVQPRAQPDAAGAKPYIGPRPRIITRKGWGASESLREKGFAYTKSVKAAFVHHTATGNSYTCKQAPAVLRSIYRYHVVSSGWRDFGYNFAVDKCGNIYEGRAGGVAKAVLGAHTLGFNTNSMGIAVLGTYSSSTPPAAAVTAVARLAAWKLGLFGANPRGKVTLTSGGSGKYKKGKKVSFNVISGHRDGFLTDCPGGRLYSKLGTARTASARYQGRG
ncbi:N-acetylmuramoyl-L-alanine amidase [Streptomyces lunaelactis]|uniref:N-acetylmuramoyl-L-alanine amidase n=1 Tax=Streptomyces lunaelactis TaxID=1535768 RepID=UPI00158545F9|nr:N-acetylmuramoyl-L-alanine amidase [Streptomyces lunaelactis]NUK38813.1 N-acetylmuramoyl-L-alanine amidase [Streptomyces lunaelactis]NUK45891.1 N-acetylmuramoyl-L-alanine amidase [Streptomyces lunaelactis]NUK96573.1 N-acetylmuramoyl-L-alanine amidase [Streptomyces lunaelactis]NUL34371.1 N-acetylmuramoyl-L-alanine amidase [Streptomyces lunaelactis]